MNQKQYRLIVGHDFSISNDTDADPMSDYSPGIWAIGSKKKALEYAREYLDQGHSVTVTTYDNPSHAKLGNECIKALGLSQELFKEPSEVPASKVTNGRPSTLSELKRLLVVGYKLHVVSHVHGDERDTFVREANTQSVVFDKEGKRSWLYWGKASEWSFQNDRATHYAVSREGEQKPTVSIVYQDSNVA